MLCLRGLLDELVDDAVEALERCFGLLFRRVFHRALEVFLHDDAGGAGDRRFDRGQLDEDVGSICRVGYIDEVEIELEDKLSNYLRSGVTPVPEKR